MMQTTPQLYATWFNSITCLAVTQNTSLARLRLLPFISIYPEVELLQRDFLTFRSAEAFISKLSVKVMLTWLLLLEIFGCTDSSTCLNFPAIILLRISRKHFQVKNILAELIPITKITQKEI